MKADLNKNNKQQVNRHFPILGRLVVLVFAIALGLLLSEMLPFSGPVVGAIAYVMSSSAAAAILNSTGSKIARQAPGKSHLQFADFFFSKKKYEAVYLPIIQDMREEYFEALSQSRTWKASWVRVRGTWSFFAALGLDRFFSVVSLCVKVWKSVN
jgi:hypothetical protein